MPSLVAALESFVLLRPLALPYSRTAAAQLSLRATRDLPASGDVEFLPRTSAVCAARLAVRLHPPEIDTAVSVVRSASAITPRGREQRLGRRWTWRIRPLPPRSLPVSCIVDTPCRSNIKASRAKNFRGARDRKRSSSPRRTIHNSPRYHRAMSLLAATRRAFRVRRAQIERTQLALTRPRAAAALRLHLLLPCSRDLDRVDGAARSCVSATSSRKSVICARACHPAHSAEEDA